MWAIGIAATLISVATWKWPTIAALPSLIVIFGALFAYVKSRRRIIEAKAAGGWYDDVETAISAQITATPLNNSALADLTAQVRFPWIWVLGSLLITAASAGIVAQGWDTIPETIPTHWGASMQPDAWSDKGIGTVFGLTFVNLGMIAVFALIFWFVCTSSVHSRSDRSIKGQLRNRAVMDAINQATGFLLFAICLPMSQIQVASALPRYAGWLPVGFIGVIVMSLVGVIALIMMILRAQTRIDDALRGVNFPDDGKDSPDNDEFYKWGMFYYNPDDPAVMVDKRFGAGMDFNYARWQAKVFMAVILLLLIGSVALPILL
ncbi:conserved membrane hypothetical protein [Corynebacterium striatum]|nr:conserved membrane hypothetical protein [Corynebacterium striatum]